MKFVAVLKDHPVHVEVQKNERLYQIDIDGRKYTVDAITSGAFSFSLLVDGRSYEVALERTVNHYTAHFSDHAVDFALYEARKYKAAELAKKTAATGILKILAPMPGKIVKVTAREGMTVAEGEPLVVMEAMKMQNEFRAPRAAIVRQVGVLEGATVTANQMLVILE